MTAALTVTGADQLAAALRRAAVDLQDMPAAHDRAAGMILAAARPPRRTGRLAASLRAFPHPAGVTVGSDVPYARPVEARTGFLHDATRRAADDVAAMYRTEVAHICVRVSA